MTLEELFEQFASAFPEPILLLQGDGSIEQCSRRYSELTGFPQADITASPLQRHVTDPPEKIEQYLRLWARNRTFVPGALTIRLSDNSTLPCRVEGARIQSLAPPPGRLLVRIIPREVSSSKFATLNLKISELGKEITRRLEAEKELVEQKEMLSITLSSIGDAVVTTDTRGCVTFMNPVTEATTGWSSEEAKGRPLSEVFVIVNEETRLPVESPVDRVIRDVETVALANHTILKRRDGSEVSIDDSGSPIRDQTGKMRGVVLVFHDVTDRRSLEKQSVSLGGQPLKSISDMMARQLGHMPRLVNDLLDVSRITSGKVTLQRRAVELPGVLKEAIESVTPLAARNVQFHFTGSLVVDGDPERLLQIFVNLLSNTCKFTDETGTFVVTASEVSREAVVSIRDSGVGMSPDFLSGIFDLFIQADQSLARWMTTSMQPRALRCC